MLFRSTRGNFLDMTFEEVTPNRVLCFQCCVGQGPQDLCPTSLLCLVNDMCVPVSHDSCSLRFAQAVFEGLAPDGGLLVPHFIPDVSKEWRSWKDQVSSALARAGSVTPSSD